MKLSFVFILRETKREILNTGLRLTLLDFENYVLLKMVKKFYQMQDYLYHQEI